MFFAPFIARADLLSSIFGNKASADTTTDSSDSTSTTISDTALQATASPASVIQNNKDSSDDIDSSTNVNTSGNALLPATNHVSIPGENDDGDSSSDQISVYVVRKGDSISQIADMFNVSVDTILSANNMKKGDKLTEGDVLLIPAVSGVEYTVKKGDTIGSIAKHYHADANDIAQYNNIADNSQLTIGDQIMLPGAEMVDEGGNKPVPNLKKKIEEDKNYYANNPSIPDDVGYFTNPLPASCYADGSCRETQGLHDKYAVDLGAPKGTSIYAAAAGTVLFARNGWNGGYGNLVIITHPNGTETYYAHQSKILTYAGDQVSQGEKIGLVGSTGHSTGPHLHFEVRGARNPGVNWSWAN